MDQYSLFQKSGCRQGKTNFSSGRELDETFLLLHSVAESWVTYFSPVKVVLTSFYSFFYGMASHLFCWKPVWSEKSFVGKVTVFGRIWFGKMASQKVNWSKSAGPKVSNTAPAVLVAGVMWVVVVKLQVCSITVRHGHLASWVIPQHP